MIQKPLIARVGLVRLSTPTKPDALIQVDFVGEPRRVRQDERTCQRDDEARLHPPGIEGSAFVRRKEKAWGWCY